MKDFSNDVVLSMVKEIFSRCLKERSVKPLNDVCSLLIQNPNNVVFLWLFIEQLQFDKVLISFMIDVILNLSNDWQLDCITTLENLRRKRVQLTRIAGNFTVNTHSPSYTRRGETKTPVTWNKRLASVGDSPDNTGHRVREFVEWWSSRLLNPRPSLTLARQIWMLRNLLRFAMENDFILVL